MLKLKLKLSFFLLSGLLILGGELLTPGKALAANSPFAGVYTGIIFGTCGPGEFALLVKNDNTMVVLAYKTTLEEGTFVDNVTINPDGTFVHGGCHHGHGNLNHRRQRQRQLCRIYFPFLLRNVFRTFPQPIPLPWPKSGNSGHLMEPFSGRPDLFSLNPFILL